MNDADFREQLADFADGELGADVRARIEAHLRGHPEDGEIVGRWQALRRAGKRVVEREPVPGDLSDRIRGRLSAERKRPVESAAHRPRVLRLGMFGLAAAAAVVLAFTLWPRESAATSVEADSFANIYRNCAVAHRHDTFAVRAALPANAIAGLREKAEFACRVPDLGGHGYHLDGACNCSPCENVRVVHAYYRLDASAGVGNSGDAVLSVFSLDHPVALCKNGKPCTACPHGNQDFRLATDGQVHLVTWKEGQRSFVVCGEVSHEELSELAEEIRSGRAPAVAVRVTPGMAVTMQNR